MIITWDLIKKPFSRYPVEAALVTLAFVISITSIGTLVIPTTQAKNAKTIVTEARLEPHLTSIRVEIAGQVKQPGVYSAIETDRLADLIQKAGGLTPLADTQYFSRTFNLSRHLSDEEKYYIPSAEEVKNGDVASNSALGSRLSSNILELNKASNNHISINEALPDELMKLDGVGSTTADKIITNRPYQTLTELVEKKVLTNSVFQKIQNSISL